MKKETRLNYISLFSGAGIGCFGFKLENFNCIATNEAIERRLNIQKNNNKCKYDSGYILGDIRDKKVIGKLFSEIERWKNKEKIGGIDVLIATPPCQGISVANHKKKNEKKRNSLIIESIKLTQEIQPKFFVFENVRSFLNTICTDLDNKDKKIREVIEANLGGYYNILFKVVNFKEYGANSSRTRTLVLGTRKDLVNITPYDIFPIQKKEKTLRDTIGHLPSLNAMGQIDKNDFYHNFKKYSSHMVGWIKDTKEGESAFDNKDPKKRPHRIIAGKIVYNQNKNGDKYKRCFWDKVAPCIHTRNDILASQATVHPNDNRVFSIRELMLMMNIPNSFIWSKKIKELNDLSVKEKEKSLSKEEINIRQSIGEAVPTGVFRQIAKRIKENLNRDTSNKLKINKIIREKDLINTDNLIGFINENKNRFSLPEMLRISELSNLQRQDHAAYYTRQDVCFSLIKELPEPDSFKRVTILEPSVGSGSFIPLLIERYKKVPEVNIDVIDIDKRVIKILKEVLKSIHIPKNIKINFINDDFLLRKIDTRYDIVIGNPPFGKIVKSKELLGKYRKDIFNNKTNNIFSFFLEKSLRLGNFVALISPKSLLSTPDLNKTRDLLLRYNFHTIIDYGEKAFSGVKIETIGVVFDTKKRKKNDIKIESYINNTVKNLPEDYVFDKKLPVWVLYRDNFFDLMTKKMKFGIFNVFRDRSITKKHTKNKGKVRVLKSRNIDDNKIIDIDKYDSYLNSSEMTNFAVSKFLNKKGIVLAPNLTYNPRACFLPQNSIADGSVAFLVPKNGTKIKKEDLSYYSTDEFREFYMKAKNFGSRSLNIDSNFVYFFGIRK